MQDEIGAFHPISLDTLISPAREWRRGFPTDFRPLQHFRDYLQFGYYPFSLEDAEGYGARLNQLIRTVVEYDMAELHDFDIRNAKKMLQLLYVLSANVPFTPNLKMLAEKSGIHRNTVNSYLHFLEQARLIRQLYPVGISVAILQKPEKIYLDNTNLAYALHPGEPDKGNLRETFFASQLRVGHQLTIRHTAISWLTKIIFLRWGAKVKAINNCSIFPMVSSWPMMPNIPFRNFLFGFLDFCIENLSDVRPLPP